MPIAKEGELWKKLISASFVISKGTVKTIPSVMITCWREWEKSLIPVQIVVDVPLFAQEKLGTRILNRRVGRLVENVG